MIVQRDFTLSQREAEEWMPEEETVKMTYTRSVRPRQTRRNRVGIGYTPVEEVQKNNHINVSAPASETSINYNAKQEKTMEKEMKVVTTSGEPTMSSREIAEYTEKQHGHIIRDIRNILSQLSDNHVQSKSGFNNSGYFFKESTYPDTLGRNKTEYLLTKKDTLLLVSGYDVVLRSKIINRWEELEKAAVKPQMDFSNPETVRMLANNWADAEQRCLALQKENKAKQKQICQMTPLAEHAEELMKSDSCLTTTQIAAELGMSARRLNENLRCSGVQYRCNGQWILYSKYKDMGLTRTRTTEYRDTDGSIKTAYNTVWTEKGRFFIHDRFM